eukprot:scaffold14.g1147.t1
MAPLARESGETGLCSHSHTYLGKRTSIQHWQLRDLIHCPREDGELYAVFGNQTRRHDLDNDMTSIVQQLSFEPTSMTVGHGFIAAGGQCSQLDVRALATGEIVYKGHCGGSVNNALAVARDASGALRLFVCNNDDTVKVYSLSSGALHAMVRCPVAINYCALSPGGRHLVCVGDNRHTYLYQAGPAGYRQCRVFTEACDAGMCCAWAPGGSLFAAASQDGLAAVWDHRNCKVVARYRTVQACRNVKFSPAPLDLMAFTEHRSRCHAVDMRMWDRQPQVLQLRGPLGEEPDISGLSYSPSGRSLYVGTEDGIAAYDVDTLARRCFAEGAIC